MHFIEDLRQRRAGRQTHAGRRVRGASRGIRRTGVGLCWGQTLFEQDPELFVACIFRKDAMTSGDSPGIGIHYEDWVLAGVEQDGVRGLWTDASQRKKLLPQFGSWLAKHPGKRAIIVPVKKVHENLDRNYDGSLTRMFRQP